MGNHAYKKEQAELHNKNRVEKLALEKDRIENPEKYKRKRRVRSGSGGRISKAQLVMVIAAGMGVNSF